MSLWTQDEPDDAVEEYYLWLEDEQEKMQDLLQGWTPQVQLDVLLLCRYLFVKTWVAAQQSARRMAQEGRRRE